LFNDNHFYFRLKRKYITLIGDLFDNINLIRTEKNSNTELERIKIPIIYGPKEHWVTRLESDPDLYREIGMILPRMSFELKNYTYDPARKQNSLLRVAKEDNPYRVNSQYMGVPFDFHFEVSIYARTIDDANHIVEQILPYFNPDYTVTISPIPELGFLKDIPIILNEVKDEITYESDKKESVRYVYTTLDLTLKGYFYGPISTPKIIRKVIANIFNDPSLKAGNVIRMNMTDGNNGTYKIGDTVYVGERMETCNAAAYVNFWNAETGKLVVGGAHGNGFSPNNVIRAASSNAAYRIESFEATPLKLASIVVEPNPIDAEPTDDYGYTTTITEWPETEYPEEA
jgi:hypothetical protein